MKNTEQIERMYSLAKEQYAGTGIDTDHVMSLVLTASGCHMVILIMPKLHSVRL